MMGNTSVVQTKVLLLMKFGKVCRFMSARSRAPRCSCWRRIQVSNDLVPRMVAGETFGQCFDDDGTRGTYTALIRGISSLEMRGMILAAETWEQVKSYKTALLQLLQLVEA